MPDQWTELRVDGLTALQLAELRAAVKAGAGDYVSAVDAPKLSGGKIGEPTLVSAVIMLAPSVISAVALWLAKQKKSRTRNLRYARVEANGARESFEIEESAYEEGESASAALEAFLKRKVGDGQS